MARQQQLGSRAPTPIDDTDPVIDEEIELQSPFPNGVPLKFEKKELKMSQFVTFLAFLSVQIPTLMNGVTRWVDDSIVGGVVELVKELNERIRHMGADIVPGDWRLPRATPDIAEKLVELARKFVVWNWTEINAVGRNNDKTDNYGEMKVSLMKELVAQLNEKRRLTEDDVFFDLGSGIGQLPMFMAAATPVKEACGIELHERRHEHALKLLAIFERIMKFAGKIYGNIELMRADLEEKLTEDRNFVSEKASFIFANNMSFCKLNLKIQDEILPLCKDGTRVLSTAQFFTGVGERKGKNPREQRWIRDPENIKWAYTEKVLELLDGFTWTSSAVNVFYYERDDAKHESIKLEALEQEKQRQEERLEKKMKRDAKRKEKLKRKMEDGEDEMVEAAPHKKRIGRPPKKQARRKANEELGSACTSTSYQLEEVLGAEEAVTGTGYGTEGEEGGRSQMDDLLAQIAELKKSDAEQKMSIEKMKKSDAEQKMKIEELVSRNATLEGEAVVSTSEWQQFAVSLFWNDEKKQIEKQIEKIKIETSRKIEAIMECKNGSEVRALCREMGLINSPPTPLQSRTATPTPVPTLVQQTSLQQAPLQQASLQQAPLQHASLQQASLQQTSLQQTINRCFEELQEIFQREDKRAEQ